MMTLGELMPEPSNPRLRVLHLPRDQFLVVLDRAEAIPDRAENRGGLDDIRDALDGCGGLLIFGYAVDIPPDGEFPYG